MTTGGKHYYTAYEKRYQAALNKILNGLDLELGLVDRKTGKLIKV